MDAIARYRDELGLPLIVKETGAGMSPQALDAIRSTGVEWVDVSGRGGTSWTRVEAARPDAPPFGGMFGDWGIPTAAATAWAVRRGFRTISSGGIRTVLDVLRALALGATLVGAARPVLIALEDDELDADAVLADWIEGLRRGCLLAGARRPAELRRVPRLIGSPLRDWISLDEGGVG
ncbi:MAG: hypothetical protein D6761_09340 [Candidatus Dadabacteria bacterium]|nr:MAG: hypothetical protein D6761_09340 [Candidatus Dadabacteria bacterium]